MPYLQNDPNEENGANATGAKGAGGSGGAFIGGGGQGATTTANPSPANTAGGYTNLLSYLGANQGAGATTGQAAENVVQQSADDATAKQNDLKTSGSTDITNAAAGLGVDASQESKIKSGVARVDQSVMNNIAAGGNSTSGGYTGPKSIDTSYKGPNSVSVAYNGPDVGSFSGKTAAADVAAQGANQTVAGNAKNAQGGQTGVSALLRSAYQQPNYTAGENNLDAFLAGGTAGGRDALGQAASVDANTQGGYAGVLSALSGQAQAARDKAKTTNDTYAADIKTAQGDTTARDAYNKAITDASAKAAAYKAPAQASPAATPAQGTQTHDSQMHVPLNPNNGAGVSTPVPSQGQPINSGIGGAVLDGASHAGGVISDKAKDYGNAVGDGVANTLAFGSGGGGLSFADGGEVDPFAMPSDSGSDPGSMLPGGQMQGAMKSFGKILPLLAMMDEGGPVPGKPEYQGDDPRNDIVPAKLSKGEIVLPNSVTQAPDAADKAAKFVAKVKSEKSHAPFANLMKRLKG